MIVGMNRHRVVVGPHAGSLLAVGVGDERRCPAGGENRMNGNGNNLSPSREVLAVIGVAARVQSRSG